MQWSPLTNYVSYSYRANPNPQRVTLTSYYDVAGEREGEEWRKRESSDDVTVVEDRTLLPSPH